MLENGTIRSLFLIKLHQIRPATLLKLARMISSEFCEIFKNAYFEEHLYTDERQQETHALSGKKNESFLVNQSRGQQVLPKNYSYLNLTQLFN